jgi:pentatricopeptide repeat protein
MPSPTIVTYNSAIAACSRAGNANMALQLLTSCKSRGVVPDKITYTTVISACARARPVKAQKALEIFQSMRAEGVKPDVVTFTAVIDACAKGGPRMRVAAAPLDVEQNYEERQSKPQAPPVYKTGPSLALELMEEMVVGEGIVPNGFTYGAVINAAAAEGKADQALELLATARATGMELGELYYLFNALITTPGSRLASHS